MTPFAQAFLDRCEQNGLDLQQTKEAVDRVGTQFGQQAFDELTAGYAEKEAVFGTLGRNAVGLFNSVGRPAARMFGRGARATVGALGTGARATGTAIDKTNQVARAGAKAVGDAQVNATRGYFGSLAGYGRGGNLQGTKLFDSTTVKPLMSRADMQARIASGATKDQLAQTHQLPGMMDRVPGMDRLRRGIDWLDRSRLAHPFVQSAKTVKNLMSTPITRPLTKPIERALLERGAANVARGGGRAVLGRMQQAGGYGLKGIDKTLGGATQAAGLATLGTGGYALYNQAANAPARNLQQLVDYVNPHAGPNPEVEATRADPLSAYIDAATDKSDIANAARATSQRALPYRLQNAAYNSVQEAQNDPTQNALSNLSRFTLGGNLTQEATKAVADPTPPPVEQFFKEEVAKRAPDIMQNLPANIQSPTGQRLIRAGTPLLTDPTTAVQVPGRFAPAVFDAANNMGLNKGGSDMTPFASAFFDRCRQNGLDLPRIKQAVDFVGTNYGPEAHAELVAGFEKLAFLDSFDKMVGGSNPTKPKAAPTAPSPGTLPKARNEVSQQTQVQQVTHPQGMGKVGMPPKASGAQQMMPKTQINPPQTVAATQAGAEEQAAGSAQQLASQYAPSGWSMMGGQQMAQGLGSMFGKTAGVEKTAGLPGKETLVGGYNFLKSFVRPSSAQQLAQRAPNVAAQVAKAQAAPAVAGAAPAVVPHATHRAVQQYMHAGPWASPGNVARMGVGGVMGSSTASNMTGGYGDVNLGGQEYFGKDLKVNPLGFFMGAATGSPRALQSNIGQTLKSPWNRAMLGSTVGDVADTGAGAFGVNTNGRLGQMGAYIGFGSGAMSNRAANLRDAARATGRSEIAALKNVSSFKNPITGETIKSVSPNYTAAAQKAITDKAMAASAPGLFSKANEGLVQFARGTSDPLRRIANTMWYGSGPGALRVGTQGMTGGQRLAHRLGQGLIYGTAGTLGAGAGYGMLADNLKDIGRELVTEMYPTLRNEMSDDADRYMYERGFLNDEGQFDPTDMAVRGFKQRAGQFFHPITQMFQPPPGAWQGGDDFGPYAPFPPGYPGAPGYPGYPGAPGTGYPGRSIADAWRQLTGGTGNPVNMPGARNELQHQTEAGRQATGQGWF